MQESTPILIPVYNDWESLKVLVPNLQSELQNVRGNYQFLIVDDGSTKKETILSESNFPINILSLKRNVGHQKAIAIGMAYIHHTISCGKVLIMDSDGEDRPEDAAGLLTTSQQQAGKIIVAHRSLRAEEFTFRFFYFFYTILFRCLTRKRIAYGNFMIKQKYPTKKQIHFWDRYIIPVSKMSDKILKYSFGKSILGIWQKNQR